MANRIQDTKLRCCILLLIALSPLLSNRFVYGRKIATTKNINLCEHKGTVKTIESEDGDTIDCVDIYQQPAFDHPALKDHIIQMVPHEDSPSSIEENHFNKSGMFQALLKTVECPEGTIPLRRTKEGDFPPIFPGAKKGSNGFTLNADGGDDISDHEYATVYVSGQKYTGARATLSVWQPKVANSGEFSLTQLWVVAGSEANLNTIEVGWMANPNQAPRLFIYWTADGYQNTGCYNHACSGFVQTNGKSVIDGVLSPISTFNSVHEITISVEKNKDNGNWWLYVQNTALGYWPASIYNSLKGPADEITFGGEIINMKSGGHHTSTQMGNGLLAKDGKASYVGGLAYAVNGVFKSVQPGELSQTVTNSKCYDLSIPSPNAAHKTFFYYGGPGFSAACP